jgi:DNA-binding PadR family transcriptional regulator
MSVRHAVLGLLAQRPRHGYELRAAFEAFVGGKETWDVHPAQIYTTLTRLEENGMIAEHDIAQEGGPEKRIYAITPQGHNALTEWFITPVDREHQRDEFFIKLMLCLATGHVDPHQVMHVQRTQLYQDLHNFTVQRSRVDPRSELARILLYDKAIMHLEADLRWMDLVQARLGDIIRQPMPEPDVKPRGRPRKMQD